MMQKDSNGDASFEIIDKKTKANINNETTSESISSISEFSLPHLTTSHSGNLLSNVPPPTTLPDIMLWSTPTTISMPAVTPNIKSSSTPIIQPLSQPFPTPQFSAAIPPSKGIQGGLILQQPPSHLQADDNTQNGGGLFGWMKDAVSSGGLLSKVAEKAKSSVDSIITTLDPQMSEFIYSDEDIKVIVASQDREEINSIRDAIYSVFGKALMVNGSENVPQHKLIAIGLNEGFKNAEEKIELVSLKDNNVIKIAIENIILGNDECWFEASVIILKDVSKQITLKGFTQGTQIPIDQLLNAAEKELPNYCPSDSLENIISSYAKLKPNWLQNLRGISRKESLLLTAKNLFKIYKEKLIY